LILCLLASFKVTSQIDTKNKYVVLTERQAKSIIKDLSRYDDLVKVDSLKDKKISELEDISCAKDDIIKEKDKIITKSSRAKFGLFAGLQYINTSKVQPYMSCMLQFKKVNVSARYYIISDNIRYSINVEYKIF